MKLQNSDAATALRKETTNTSWHAQTAAAVGVALESDISRGLSEKEVEVRRARDGPNALAAATQRSALSIALQQFKSLIVGLLAVAAGVAFVLGDVVESVAILIVILLNALIGFITEMKAAQALAGLRKQAVRTARVRREGAEHQISAKDLVSGDVVLLAAGDRVPADGRVFDDAALEVDEATLTGESLPVKKSTEAVLEQRAALGDRTSMVHMGTAVTAGRGGFLVTGTGAATEMGKVGTLIDDVESRGTPLEAKLEQLSRALLVIVLVLCVVIVVVGWLRGIELLYMVEIGVSLAIAAVPEGLLAVTTMTLAVGMQRMARMHALVRRLPAVEALGSATVICTDKTGTLTRNEMTVRAFALGASSSEQNGALSTIDVTGAGFATDGAFLRDGETIDVKSADDDDPLALALRIGALCNDAKVDRSSGTPVVLGDPTEAALIVAAEKSGMVLADLAGRFPRVKEVPFNSESMRMVTVHRRPEGGDVAYVKGSPDAILDASTLEYSAHGATRPMSDDVRARVKGKNEALASSALRVLGLAFRELKDGWSDDDLERELSFVGLVGMVDPLRDEAADTVARCRKAGIRVVMITGDQQATATEIAKELKLDAETNGTTPHSMHGRALHDLDDQGWLDVVKDTSVYARVSPEDKLKIVDALQRQGHIVAMTGDGVNDAPALSQADIGIAMGIRGTEVAKEAADMVITDDNFATIVGAVEQGRIIVHNILRFIHFLFSSNLAEIVTVFVAIMIGWPLPLGVLQILWLNLVTDIFPAMALALEPSAPDVMAEPPRDPNAPLMTGRFAWLIVWQGSLLAATTLAAFAVGMHWYGAVDEGLKHAVTIAFMSLALAQVFHAYNARSHTRSVFSTGFLKNKWLFGATFICILLQFAAIYLPPLQRVLGTVPLSAADWGLIATAALSPVVVVEGVKWVQRLRTDRKSA